MGLLDSIAPKINPYVDCYAVLHVGRDATMKEIHRAYLLCLRQIGAGQYALPKLRDQELLDLGLGDATSAARQELELFNGVPMGRFKEAAQRLILRSYLTLKSFDHYHGKKQPIPEGQYVPGLYPGTEASLRPPPQM